MRHFAQAKARRAHGIFGAMSTAFEPIREKLTQILLVTPEENMYADVLDLLLGVFESEFGYLGTSARRAISSARR